jgi:hypothetical protein
LVSIGCLLALTFGCGDDSGAADDAGDGADAGPSDAASPEPDAEPGDAGLAREELGCPGEGHPLERATGVWILRGPCTVSGVTLTGDADVRVESDPFVVAGDIRLSDDARLSMDGGTLRLPQHTTSEYALDVSGRAILETADLTIETNGGEPANLYLNLDLHDDARATFTRTELDFARSWILANVRDRATLENVDSVHVPCEIYPQDSATVSVRGPASDTGVWVVIPPGATAVMDGPPAGSPFTYSFGRGQPGTSGLEYLVEVQNGHSGFGVISTPRSDLTVRDNGAPIVVGYFFAGVTEPQLLEGLEVGGPQTSLFTHQDRRLALERAALNPLVAWQIYNDNAGVASPETVLVRGALVNEIGALTQGRIAVEDSTLQFAVIAAIGPGSRVEVTRTNVHSQTIQTEHDGVITLRDSHVFGSRLQARGTGRIRLENTVLDTNHCHPGCLPRCLDFTGGDRCNAFNPSIDPTLVATDAGAILMARLAPIADVTAGSPVPLTGDAGGIGADPMLAGVRYRVAIRPEAAGASEAVTVAEGAGPVRDAALGELDTATLVPGTHVVRLELLLPASEEPLAVERTFTILAPAP